MLTVWPSAVTLPCISPSPCQALGVSLENERHEPGPIVSGCLSGMENWFLQKHGAEQVAERTPLTRKHTTVAVRAHEIPDCNDSEAQG